MIKSYLSDRKLIVNYQNTLSIEHNILTGSPQGANLSPFLYILYTNCIYKEIRYCSTLLFADDTSLFIAGRNIRCLKAKLKNDLDHLRNYFVANELTLNLEKTCIMLFRKPNWGENQLNLCIDNVLIQQVKSVRFLGILLDDTLSWNSHVNYLHSKLRSGIYQLRSSKHLTNLHGKKLLYSSFILSHLTYGITLYYQCNKRLKKLIRQKQIESLKIVFGTNSKSDCLKLMKRHKMLTLDQISTVEYAKISFRYVNELISRRICNLFENNKQLHSYNTRNKNTPRVKKFNSTMYQNSFLARSPSNYLCISCNTKESKNLRIFKNKIKKELLSK